MANPSISSRFAVSFLANLLRGGLAFITTLIIARVLEPAVYGDYVFLLASFTAVKSLTDFGASQAFFTLMSQKFRGRSFILSYVTWQVFQFVLIISILGILFSKEWIEHIWLGEERSIVLLCFCAVFLQISVWQTMEHIAESFRRTHQIQYLNIGIVATHFCLVVILWIFNSLTKEVVFGLIILEYVIALGIAFPVLSLRSIEDNPFNLKETLEEYRVFCSPLILLGGLSFCYQFADRWLLQYFGGSQEQGFYSIGYRFSVVSLLATTSILKIFWKEIAEAQESSDIDRVRKLYKKVTRLLFMVGAVVSGFLIPWSADIIDVTLGSSYSAGSITLAVMLLYPLHQSLGQINITMLYASGKTKTHFNLSFIFMGISIPVTYLVLASETAVVPGFGLGAVGMAVKMLVLQLIMVNVGSWWLARIYGWQFDWKYQMVIMGNVLLAGWMSYEIAFWLGAEVGMGLIARGLIAFSIYSIAVGLLIWFLPRLTGLSQEEIKGYFVSGFKFVTSGLSKNS